MMKRFALTRGWRVSVRPTRMAWATLFALLLAALPLAAQDKNDATGKDDNDSIGFNASKNANAKDIGLPLYPKSRRHKDNSDDSSSIQFGAWGGASGFKLALLKMESDDAPKKVTAFYRKALAKYGKVLDCSDPAAAAAEKDKPSGLGCESNDADSGETVLKAGTKDEKRIVSVKSNGSGSVYDLVYVEAKGSLSSQ